MRLFLMAALLGLGTLATPTQAQEYGSYSRSRVYIEPYSRSYVPSQSYQSNYGTWSNPYGRSYSSYYSYPSWGGRLHYHPPVYHQGYWHDGHYHPGHWHPGYWHRR